MRKMLEDNYNKVFRQGSDISQGAIDNSSQWLSAKHERTGAFKTTANFGGDRITGHRGVESFEIPGTQASYGPEKGFYAEWRRKQLASARSPEDAHLAAARNASAFGGVLPSPLHSMGPTGQFASATDFPGTPVPTTVATAAAGGTPGATPLVEEAQSRVAGIRRGAIDPQLRESLQYAGEQAGVSTRVTSGGQPSEGGARTGSHRHDRGRAADLDIIDPQTGHVLARGDPRRLKFLEEAAAVGAGGTGAGYMSDPLKVHVGITGSKAVVGEGLGAYAGSPAERAAVARGLERFKKDPNVLQRRAEAAQQQQADAAQMARSPDPETAHKGRMLFLQGIEARETGKGRTPADQEANARRIAAARGEDFESIGGAQGPDAQEAAVRKRLAQGGITEVEAFSMGGYTAKRVQKDFPNVKFDALGATKSGADPRFPGVHHLDLTGALANREEAAAKARGAAAPGVGRTASAIAPTSTGLPDAHAAIKDQHAQLQAHLEKNPIKVPIEPPNLASHRQAFSRSVAWARKRTEARRTTHEALVDGN
jgi:hypothetical protein